MIFLKITLLHTYIFLWKLRLAIFNKILNFSIWLLTTTNVSQNFFVTSIIKLELPALIQNTSRKIIYITYKISNIVNIK